MPPNGMNSYRPPVMGLNHVISSGNFYASMAGYQMLEAGGNAVDAGVASGIAINVTQPHFTSFGGVAPIIVYIAERDEMVSISGLGRWPEAADLKEFKSNYGEIPDGILRSVVPAACDAWLTALELYGTMTFEQVVLPAMRLASEGFPMSAKLCQSLNNMAAAPQKWEYNFSVMAPTGLPVKPSQPLVQKDLAGVFWEMIEVERANSWRGRNAAIRAARDHFYKGAIAEKMVAFSQSQGGLLSLEDFAKFNVGIEKPESGHYGDYSIYTCGFWCQGPSLIEILNILEGFDLQKMGLNSTDYIHVLTESIKLAFSDRHYYYGDPEFADVPTEGILSKSYADERRNMIDLVKAFNGMPPMGNPWPHQGIMREPLYVTPPEAKAGPGGPDTSYTCVVDKWGNAFSATPSDGIWGSPLVPGLGMIISNRGSQSWLEEDHPSRLEPFKRPRLTPNPSMAFKNGRLYMPFGTPGGDFQVQGMVQMFLNMVEFGMDTQQAVEEARVGSLSFPNSFWPHSYLPGSLQIEGRISSEVIGQLEDRGHKVERIADWGNRSPGLCGVMVDHEIGTLIGGADPRLDSFALGR